LGVDLGLKRVGVALFRENISIPLEPIIRKNRNQAANELRGLISEYGAEKLVFGVPQGSSGEEMRRRIEHFVSLLEFGGEIFYIDEDFSSMEALEATKGVFRDKKSGKIDSISAKIILDRWAEAKP